jgi:hypothetical protein
MRKIILAMAAVFALVSSGSLTPDAMADEAPVVRHSKKIPHICPGPHCGPLCALWSSVPYRLS